MPNGLVPKKTGKMRKDAARNRRAEILQRRVSDFAILAWKASRFHQHSNLRAKNLINPNQHQLQHRHLAMMSHPAARTNPKWMRFDAFYIPMQLLLFPCLFPSLSNVSTQTVLS